MNKELISELILFTYHPSVSSPSTIMLLPVAKYEPDTRSWSSNVYCVMLWHQAQYSTVQSEQISAVESVLTAGCCCWAVCSCTGRLVLAAKGDCYTVSVSQSLCDCCVVRGWEAWVLEWTGSTGSTSSPSCPPTSPWPRRRLLNLLSCPLRMMEQVVTSVTPVWPCPIWSGHTQLYSAWYKQMSNIVAWFHQYVTLDLEHWNTILDF